MFCQKCGTEFQTQAAFCLKCGHKLQVSSTPRTSNKALWFAAIAAGLSIGAAAAGLLFRDGTKPNTPPILAMVATGSTNPSPNPTPSPKTYNPSFDCSKATDEDLKLICTNADLAALDRQMAQTFSDIISRSNAQQAKSVRSQQRDWLRNIRKGCIDADCLRTTYKSRLDELKAMRPEPQQTDTQSQPTNVGQTSQLAFKGRSIVNATFAIKPGNIVFYTMPLAYGSPVRIFGRFEAQGGMRDNVEVYIFDEDGFTNFKSGNRAPTYYNSGRVTVGQIDVTLASNGQTYYLVFSNDFSVISNKVVNASVSASAVR